MKKLLNDLNILDYDKIERSFGLALEKLNSQLLLQMKGIAEPMKYMSFFQELHS
jgi:hypothetical protein